ncbi:MAG: glycosyltransferase [Gemmatimonadaceae bacterium]
MLDVVFVHRKPHRGNFSLERLFADIRSALPSDIVPRVWECPYLSQGLFRRVYNMLAATAHQGTVTHITGDVNYVALLLRRSRTLLTLPDIVLLHRLKGWRRAVAKALWFRLPAARVARIVTISEAVRQEVIRVISCAPQFVTTIHVPISTRFTPDPRRFNVARPRILMLGSAWNKNLARQTEALRGLSCEVDFVGLLSDEHRSAFEKAGVTFTHSFGLSDEEMHVRYKSCDLVLFASLYEGFGMPIAEAQAVGRPVVTSTTSSMPEVAGDAACLVDPTNTTAIRAGVDKVIRDEEYRAGLVSRGYVNASRFAPARIAAQYAELYRELAQASA